MTTLIVLTLDSISNLGRWSCVCSKIGNLTCLRNMIRSTAVANFMNTKITFPSHVLNVF